MLVLYTDWKMGCAVGIFRRDSISMPIMRPPLIDAETRKPPRVSRRKEASQAEGQPGNRRMISGLLGRGATLCSRASYKVIVSRPKCSTEWAIAP